MPPWIFGCSVLTRPSIISGKPVTSATVVTGKPASASAFAVPPVEIKATPAAARARANGTSPALSETLKIARILLDFLDISLRPPVVCRRRWRASVVSRGRALAVFFYVRPVCGAPSGSPGRRAGSCGDHRRVIARQGKYDAYHRQGQVVQQRQGLRIHRARRRQRRLRPLLGGPGQRVPDARRRPGGRVRDR